MENERKLSLLGTLYTLLLVHISDQLVHAEKTLCSGQLKLNEEDQEQKVENMSGELAKKLTSTQEWDYLGMCCGGANKKNVYVNCKLA